MEPMETMAKVIARCLVGLLFGCGASITDAIKAIREDKKRWIVVAFSFIFIVSAYILFGVWNPVPARVEETLLGAVVYLMAILPSIEE